MSAHPILESNRNIELPAQINILDGIGQGIETAIEDSDGEIDEPDKIASQEEFFKAMEDAYKNDKDLQTKLLYNTLHKIRYYAFKDELDGQNAEDVIQNVLELIINGKRKWNQTKFPNVVNYLIVAIHSHVRNESKKKEKWKSIDIYDEEGRLKENLVEKFVREAIAEDLSEEFFKNRLEDLINKCLIKLKDDINAYCVLDEILKNDTEEMDDKTLVLKLGISHSEVKLAKRRIRYTVNQIIKNK